MGFLGRRCEKCGCFIGRKKHNCIENRKKGVETRMKNGSYVGWNKGIKTGPNIKLSQTRKRLFKEGKLKSYNKGKSIKIKIDCEYCKKSFLGYKHRIYCCSKCSELDSIRIIPWNKGKKGKSNIKISRTRKMFLIRIKWKCADCRKERMMKPCVAKRTTYCINCRFKGDRNCNSIPGVKEKKSKALKGRLFTEETKRKMSENHPDMSMEKNPSWLGGKSFEPYTTEFNDKFKELIRKRDNYICQECGKKQGKRKLCVHHIDYNKKNSILTNLISLCIHCHIKTNCNRNSWKLKLTKLQEVKK